MGIKFTLPSNVSEALNRADCLGFDSPQQAAEAILTHDDWLTRWDFKQQPFSDVQLLNKWYINMLVQQNPHPQTTSKTHYIIKEKGSSGYYAQDGYSRYPHRLRLKEQNPDIQVYGYEQALHHIKELREKYSDMANKPFCVVIVSTIETEIPA